MDGLYGKKHLLEALAKAARENPRLNIGSSYVTLLKYEEKGVVLPPENPIAVTGSLWRFYSREEIEENVRRVVAHKSQGQKAIK